MRMGTSTTLQSSLCFSSSYQPSSPFPPSNSHLPNTPLTPTKPNKILQKHYLYAPKHKNLSLQFKEKILCLKIMGVDSGKALSQNPSLHKDLTKNFVMCPKILTSNVNSDLNPIFNFLFQELKVPESKFRKVINKCPRLLASSAKDQLKPALFYLQRLGFKDLEALAYHDAVLLVSIVENTLIPKLGFLQSLGFSKEEAVGMVLRCLALFTFSIENNYKPKFEYFTGEMGRKLEELKEFPQYFAFSLDKRIKPRHMEVVEREELVWICLKCLKALMRSLQS
ncbi:hypothetical protein UlMin_045642 [Ulmus minor]